MLFLLRMQMLGLMPPTVARACGVVLRRRCDGQWARVLGHHSSSVGPVPPTRVEVRSTAGRSIISESFAVGRGPECDVQTSGDGTVSRLQFIAVSIPGGVVVADAWSGGGTRVVRRFGAASSKPASVPGRRVAFLVPHGERVVFLIGARTTVTFGPPLGAAGAITALSPPAVAASQLIAAGSPSVKSGANAAVPVAGSMAVPSPQPASPKAVVHKPTESSGESDVNDRDAGQDVDMTSGDSSSKVATKTGAAAIAARTSSERSAAPDA